MRFGLEQPFDSLKKNHWVSSAILEMINVSTINFQVLTIWENKMFNQQTLIKSTNCQFNLLEKKATCSI